MSSEWHDCFSVDVKEEVKEPSRCLVTIALISLVRLTIFKPT